MPLHRDDIPYKDMEEIERLLKEQIGKEFPDADKMKVVCVGDIPEEEIPDEVKKGMAQLDAKAKEYLVKGKCFDCDKPIPINWNEFMESGENKPLPKGWAWCKLIGGDNLILLICPECGDYPSC